MASKSTTAINGDLLKWVFRGMLIVIFVCIAGLFTYVHAVEKESACNNLTTRECLSEIKTELRVLNARTERIEQLLRERKEKNVRTENGSN